MLLKIKSNFPKNITLVKFIDQPITVKGMKLVDVIEQLVATMIQDELSVSFSNSVPDNSEIWGPVSFDLERAIPQVLTHVNAANNLLSVLNLKTFEFTSSNFDLDNSVSIVQKIYKALSVLNQKSGKIKAYNYSNHTSVVINTVLIDTLRITLLINWYKIQKEIYTKLDLKEFIKENVEELFRILIDILDGLSQGLEESEKDKNVTSYQEVSFDPDTLNLCVFFLHSIYELFNSMDKLTNSFEVSRELYQSLVYKFRNPARPTLEFDILDPSKPERLTMVPKEVIQKELNDSSKYDTRLDINITEEIYIYNQFGRRSGYVNLFDSSPLKTKKKENQLDYIESPLLLVKDKSITYEQEIIITSLENLVLATFKHFAEVDTRKRIIKLPIYVSYLDLGNATNYSTVHYMTIRINNNFPMWQVAVMTMMFLYESYFNFIFSRLGENRLISCYSISAEAIAILSEKGFNFPRPTDSRLLPFGYKSSFINRLKEEF